jgi:resuscitation-promoting factor RpfB
MKKYLSFGIALALVVLGAFLLYIALQRVFVVQIDGVRSKVASTALTNGGILKAAGAKLAENDCVQPPPNSFADPTRLLKLEHNRQVTLLAQPGNTLLKSTTCNPLAGGVASSAGLLLFPGDSIWQGLQKLDPSNRVENTSSALVFRRAFPITLTENGENRIFYSSASTLGEALAEVGYQLTLADIVSMPLETGLTGPLEVSLQRAQSLAINTGGVETSTFAAGSNVGEALAQAGVSLQGLDYSVPGESEPLPADGKIKVVHVREETSIQETFLPYNVKYIQDPITELDHQSIVSSGQQGIQAERLRVRLEDGKEVSRVSDAKWTVQDPVPEQRGYGTKVQIRTLDTPNGPVQYWRAVNVYATSYSPCRSGVSKCMNGTSSGMPVAQGTIGVTRAWYNLMVGQKLYVPGYGTGVIGDVGGGIPGKRWIDLAYTDDTYIPWSQYVTIYFLTPVPDNIPGVLP